jgi:hypothetical protein
MAVSRCKDRVRTVGPNDDNARLALQALSVPHFHRPTTRPSWTSRPDLQNWRNVWCLWQIREPVLRFSSKKNSHRPCGRVPVRQIMPCAVSSSCRCFEMLRVQAVCNSRSLFIARPFSQPDRHCKRIKCASFVAELDVHCTVINKMSR